MTKEELIEKGNEAIRRALEDALIIINSEGNILSKRRNVGNTEHDEHDDDEMFFSPKIDCTDDYSTIIFDSEDDAKNAMENVLFPQEPNEKYFSIKITKYNQDDGDEIVNIKTDNNGVEGESKTFVNGKEEKIEDRTIDLDDIGNLLNIEHNEENGGDINEES